MALLRAHNGFMWEIERVQKTEENMSKPFWTSAATFFDFLHAGNMRVIVMRKNINRQKWCLLFSSNNSIEAAVYLYISNLQYLTTV